VGKEKHLEVHHRVVRASAVAARIGVSMEAQVVVDTDAQMADHTRLGSPWVVKHGFQCLEEDGQIVSNVQGEIHRKVHHWHQQQDLQCMVTDYCCSG